MIKRVLRFVQKRLFPTDFDREYLRWLEDRGERTLRYNYNLNSGSLVWDVGGYKGEFAKDIHCKYSSAVHVFEPFPSFYQEIKDAFKINEHVKVFNFGLSGQNKKLEFGISDNATSAFVKGNTISLDVRDASEVYKELSVSKIDLMKINIEGGEYELIQKMFDSGMINHVGSLQIQFHNFVPNAETLYEKAQEQLSKTHKRTWCYKFIWENWEKK